MNKRRWIGLFLLVTGIIFILDSNLGITGFTIGEQASRTLGTVLGFGFTIGGISLFLASKREAKESDLVQNVRKSGVVMSKAKDVAKLAKKAGYFPVKEGREGYVVYGDEEHTKKITTIPNHMGRGTFYNILKALESGESNLRRYGGAA